MVSDECRKFWEKVIREISYAQVFEGLASKPPENASVADIGLYIKRHEEHLREAEKVVDMLCNCEETLPVARRS